MKKYFVYDGQAKKGPFDLEELKTQPLRKETLIWHEDLKDWTKVMDLEEFKDFFLQPIPPPLPKASKVNIQSRDKLLSSFTDAAEAYPEVKKRSYLIPIIILLIIVVAIIVAIYVYMHFVKK
jgi:hypothetical protein